MAAMKSFVHDYILKAKATDGGSLLAEVIGHQHWTGYSTCRDHMIRSLSNHPWFIGLVEEDFIFDENFDSKIMDNPMKSNSLKRFFGSLFRFVEKGIVSYRLTLHILMAMLDVAGAEFADEDKSAYNAEFATGIFLLTTIAPEMEALDEFFRECLAPAIDCMLDIGNICGLDFCTVHGGMYSKMKNSILQRQEYRNLHRSHKLEFMSHFDELHKIEYMNLDGERKVAFYKILELRVTNLLNWYNICDHVKDSQDGIIELSPDPEELITRQKALFIY